MNQRITMLVLLNSLLLGCSTISVADDSHHYIGKKYYISENTELIYPRKSNPERYKVCERIKSWLEGKDVPVKVLKPVYSGKSLEEEGFQKYLSDCDVSRFEKSSDMSPHWAENKDGEKVVYWTTTGNYYESRYFELYANDVNVLYTGPQYKLEEGSKYVRGGIFFVLKSNSCETGGAVSETNPSSLTKHMRASLSEVIKYNQSYYIVRVKKEHEKSKTKVSVFSIVNDQLGTICSLNEK